MKKFIAAAVVGFIAASSAWAQTATTPSTDPETPAVATPEEQNPTAPVAGANSFTEDQAKSRIEEAGYTDVTELKLDDQGIWWATAMKDSKSATVGLDYQGNIVTK